MTANIKLLHSCSFCGKNQTQVKTLIAGSGAYICNECVTLCGDVIKPKDEAAKDTTSADRLTPPEIVDYLNQYVIGQDVAKKTLAVAIYNHLKRIVSPEIDGVAIDKSNILMIGSSGSGKTLMVSTLSKILKVPFATVDATSLSQTGYVGLDPEECLARLFQAAENDLERAQKGIIFIDEIDKIGRKSGENVSTTRDVSGEGVQQALLKIIEGNDVKFTPAGGRKNPNGEFATINTRNILFILGGAFEGLAKHIAARNESKETSIGFFSSVRDPDLALKNFELVQQVTVEDLISFGMIPELVGRIPVVVPFEDLNEDTLVRILVEPKNAIVRQFEKMFQSEGLQLKFEPEALTSVAKQVMNSKTGARGLRRVIEGVLMNTQFLIHKHKKDGVGLVRVTQDTIEKSQEPELVHSNSQP
jgi:ATP-dependent Clp protease ATP-binding subunit ClpX